MNNRLFSTIRTKYNQLSESQKSVADYIMKHSEKIMFSTLSETADACGVSEPTVLRFLHKIGYTSFQVFKINLSQELAEEPSKTSYSDVTFDDSTKDVMEKVISSTVNAVTDSRQMIDIEVVEEVTDRIMSAKKVFVIGVGASSFVASDMNHKFLRLGINSVCGNDPHIINIMANNLTPDDFMIVISHSGGTREILDAIALASLRDCDVCAVTSYKKSAIANQVKYVLCSSSLETRFRSDAMASRIIQMIITDILYVTIVVKSGDKILKQINDTRKAVAKNKV